MRIWLINSAEATPLDEGTHRLRRTPLLARALRNRGHEVVWWSADFFHATKKHRFGEDRTIELESDYTIHFLHGPGYTKHVSLARFRDHRIIAHKFLKKAEQEPKPDVILCSLPTLDLADAVTQFGKKHSIPVVLDIRDLWPDIFWEKVPRIVSPLAKLVTISLQRQASRACRNATAICGNSPMFVQWGLKHAGRAGTPSDRDFPFGYAETRPTEEEIGEANRFWKQKGVDPEHHPPIVCFFGTIGNLFQFESALDAAKRVSSTSEVLFVFCGDGLMREKFQFVHGGEKNILFPGWINGIQIGRLMEMSVVALSPYSEMENFRNNLTNKTIEYMAGGLPILFSIDNGYVADLIRENEIGLTYGGSANRLAECILKLLTNEPYRKKLGENARNLFLKQYQSEAVYPKMAEYLENIALK